MLLKANRRIITKEICLTDSRSLLAYWLDESTGRVFLNSAEKIGIERWMLSLPLWTKVKSLCNAGASTEDEDSSSLSSRS